MTGIILHAYFDPEMCLFENKELEMFYDKDDYVKVNRLWYVLPCLWKSACKRSPMTIWTKTFN